MRARRETARFGRSLGPTDGDSQRRRYPASHSCCTMAFAIELSQIGHGVVHRVKPSYFFIVSVWVSSSNEEAFSGISRVNLGAYPCYSTRLLWLLLW